MYGGLDSDKIIVIRGDRIDASAATGKWKHISKTAVIDHFPYFVAQRWPLNKSLLWGIKLTKKLEAIK